jgi:hypothetical protein
MIDAAPGFVQPAADCASQLIRQGHAAAHPARHHALVLRSAPHPGGHVAHPHQLEHFSAQRKTVARAQPGDKTLLDLTDPRALEVFDLQVDIAGNGSDRHAVHLGNVFILHGIAPVPHDHPVVQGIRFQCRAAARDEIEAPFPFAGGQAAISARRAHLSVQVVRLEAPAQSDRHQVLHQHIQRLFERRARLDLPLLNSRARRGIFDQLERLGGHAGHAAFHAGLVPAATGALQQARHALRTADLEDAVDRGEIYAQIEAGSADHTAQAAAPQVFHDPLARLWIERAVVQRHDSGPIGALLQDGLVPDLGLRAGVGEDQARCGTARSPR